MSAARFFGTRSIWRVFATLLALALLAVATQQTLRLLQALQYNRAFETGTAAAHDAPASTLFVRAHAAAAQGRVREALDAYQVAARDPDYAVAAAYNIGNLHLREALELESRGELSNQPQAAELAKRHFRAALRLDPTHWPSKYNLERVLHLVPEAGDDTVAPGHAADRVVTSLRGFTLGLP